MKRVEKQISSIEQLIEKKENEKASIETRMITPESVTDTALFERHSQLKKELQDDMKRWEKLTMEQEMMQNN
jgi:ATP-binding cassette subfamily F protein 3